MQDLVQLVLNTTPIAKGVLIILAILSVLSWMLIFEKIGRFIKIEKESKRFLKLFKERTSWTSLYNASRSYKASPHAFVFMKGFSEFYAWKRKIKLDEEIGDHSDSHSSDIYPSSLPRIMESAITESLSYTDRWLIVLAITVSASPFLGLFGTVWGVMRAFLSIGIRGSADISTVGPGIAEALITTVVGLAVAIPALVAYNLIVARLRRMEDRLGAFSTDLIRLFERERAP